VKILLPTLPEVRICLSGAAIVFHLGKWILFLKTLRDCGRIRQGGGVVNDELPFTLDGTKGIRSSKRTPVWDRLGSKQIANPAAQRLWIRALSLCILSPRLSLAFYPLVAAK
jgi:hypothetical protein